MSRVPNHPPKFEAMLEKLVGPALIVPGENMSGAAREVRDELDRKIAKLKGRA